MGTDALPTMVLTRSQSEAVVSLDGGKGEPNGAFSGIPNELSPCLSKCRPLYLRECGSEGYIKVTPPEAGTQPLLKCLGFLQDDVVAKALPGSGCPIPNLGIPNC